jgi:hypothetical protein
MNYAYYDVIGSLGVAMIVGSYFLLQIERIDSRSVGYSLLNGIGAGLILFSLYFDFNWSAVSMEVFWVFISLIGLARFFVKRNESVNKNPSG